MTFRNLEHRELKDLTEEERLGVINALVGGTLQHYRSKVAGWRKTTILCNDEVYRVKPANLVVPWDILHESIKYVTYAKKQGVLAFSEKPEHTSTGYWQITNGGIGLDKLVKFNTSGVDDCCVERPNND